MTIAACFRVERPSFVLDVDLALPARGITGLYGPSGSGKTTLLRAVAGLERHPGGRLRIGGAVWQDAGVFVPPHRRAVGYVFQEPSLFAHLTVGGNLAYGRRRAPRAERRVALERAVDLLGIGPLLDRRPAHLSGGERQRAAIARALAAGPRLLLMDEPLASLDRERKAEILPYLESLHRELDIPVIYVSHALDEVTRLADHLVRLEDGRAAAAGPVADMLTRLDPALAGGGDAAALIAAVVAAHDDAYHLTRLDSAAGPFTVLRLDCPPGAAVRLRVAARDVSLTLSPPSGTSIRNVFPAIVEAVAPAGPGLVTVRLRVDEEALLSRITRKSADELGVAPGAAVYAQVKSVALVG